MIQFEKFGSADQSILENAVLYNCPQSKYVMDAMEGMRV